MTQKIVAEKSEGSQLDPRRWIALAVIVAAQFMVVLDVAIVNGAAGLAVRIGGRPVAVIGFSVAGGRILEIDLVADPEKLRGLAS